MRHQAVRERAMRAARAMGLSALLLGAASAQAQQTWYVDDDAPGDPGPGNPSVSDPLENGTPQHPYDAIQQAVNRAATGDTILVLPGTYRGTGNRNITFLGKGLVVESRDGPATCTVDAQSQGRGFELASGEPPGTQIRGLTVRGASSGGVYALLSSVRLVNCRLINNGSPGLVVDVQAFVEVYGTTIADNSTSLDGGGVRVDTDSIVMLAECVIRRNTAARDGGGISGSASHVLVYNSVIADNTAGGSVFGGGGAIYYGSTGGIANSLITANRTSARDGGGVLINSESAAALRGNTIVQNRAARAGGGVFMEASPASDIANSVLWSNLPQAVSQPTGGAAVVYSVVQGGWPGEGNSAGDPQFIDPAGPDGNPQTWADNNYRPGPSSPCIDSGDTSLVAPDHADLDGDTVFGEPTPFDLDRADRLADMPGVPDTGVGMPAVDRGAYEAAEACVVDLNGDGVVDFADYLEFLNLFDAGDLRVDFSGEGIVDFGDYLEFLNLYDAGC